MAGSTDRENDQTEYNRLDAHCSDPATALPEGDVPPMRPEWEPRALVEAMFGSVAAAEEFIRQGRPALGASRPAGPSPTVRGRLTRADFARLQAHLAKTGKTQSQVVREGVSLVLASAEAS
jgi:hypothetical protein